MMLRCLLIQIMLTGKITKSKDAAIDTISFSPCAMDMLLTAQHKLSN